MPRSEPIQPNPQIYPKCSTCEVPYALRRGFVHEAGALRSTWAWTRDCRHKGAPPAMVDDRPKRTPKKARRTPR
jgi:hypothetical protein